MRVGSACWGLLGVVIWLSSGCGTSPAERQEPKALIAVDAPALLRLGSPLRVRGAEVGRGSLRLLDDKGRARLAVELGEAIPVGEGASLLLEARGHLERVSGLAPEEEMRLVKICLLGPDGGVERALELGRCLPIQERWSGALKAGPVVLELGESQLGQRLTISATGLLLPGEGSSWLELRRDGGVSVAVSLETSLALGRTQGRLSVSPSWMGVVPGPRVLEWRLILQAQGLTVHGPWRQGTTTLLPLVVSPLEASRCPGQLRGIQRGMRLPFRLLGAPPPGEEGAWEAAIGLEAGVGEAISSWWPVQVGWWQGEPTLSLPSSLWFSGGWASGVAAGLKKVKGQLRIMVHGSQGEEDVRTMDIDLPLKSTQQIVVLEFGEAFDLGLQRYGLWACAAAVRERVLARVAELYSGLRVQVYEEPPPGAMEYVRVVLLDSDPNGLSLLGLDSSPGKDVGNLSLGEQLTGLSPAAWVAGDAAWGGVFLAGFEAFSPTLRPGGAVVDERFDEIFSPVMPALGGSPATNDKGEQVQRAVEVLGRLVGGSVAHEVGHTLGLAAAPGLMHHASDHPGWLMDAGFHRPFAERAGLPGAPEEVWGAVDSAYLQAILGLQAPLGG